MILDAFCHYLPEPVYRRFQQILPDNFGLKAFEKLPELWNIDARLRVMEEYPGYKQILSLSNPPIELLGSPEDTPGIARFANDALAQVCRAHPDRFPCFIGSLPMNNPAAAVIEADRLVEEAGAVGVQIYTNVLGRPLSGPEYLPLFEAMVRHDLPVWIHPMRAAHFPDYATEDHSENEAWFTFGWPYETSVAVTRLIFAGIFDKLPTLKIITHHMGGMIPYFSEKIGIGFNQIFNGAENVNPLAIKAGLKRPLLDYYHMLYADTAVNGSRPATACGHAFFGTDKVLFASDGPFDYAGGRKLMSDTIDAVQALPIPAEERDAILIGNARKLLRLDR